MDEQGPHALSARGDGVPADRGDEARVAVDRGDEARLELDQVRARLVEDGLGVHGRVPTCRATLPPPRSR